MYNTLKFRILNFQQRQYSRAGRAQVAGEIRLSDGTLTAECKAVVVRPPKEILDNWENEKPYWKVYDD